MAEKKLYIGSLGPFLYDDSVSIDDPDGDFSGQNCAGLVTDGNIVSGGNVRGDKGIFNGGVEGYTIIKTVTASTANLSSSDYVVVCNRATAVSLYLHALSTMTDTRGFIIKNIGAGIVTIYPDNTELIDNLSSLALLQWETTTLRKLSTLWGRC